MPDISEREGTLRQELRVAFLPEEAGDVSNAVCVVIDALRATTVVATLFERGASCVYVAADYDTARSCARSKGLLLCGESGGFKPEGFDYGNSPTEFAGLDLHSRGIALATTNGTRATTMVSNAAAVLLGAATNLSSVAEAAWRIATEGCHHVVVVCSGTGGKFTLEDATVAGLYVEAIAARAGAWDAPSLSDAAIAARRLWHAEPNLLRGWMEGRHAQRLADIGFGDDVAYCSRIDTNSTVPVLVGESSLESVRWPVLIAG